MTEPTKLQVVEPGLPELAQRIKAAHAGVLEAARNVVAKAISAGHLLTEAKAKLSHGQFLPWLGEHCELSERTAHRYMQLATNARRIEAPLNGKSATMATLSLNKAMRLIEDKPDKDGLGAASRYAKTQETLINMLEQLLPEDVDEFAKGTIAELEKAVAKRKPQSISSN